MTTKQTAWQTNTARAVTCLVVMGATACTIENPCPTATRPSDEEQRCTDAGGPPPVDAALGPVSEAPTLDASARDAAAPTAPDTSLALPMQGPGAEAGSALPPVAAPAAKPMVSPPQPWPDHLVPVCWASESVARADFTALAAEFRAVAEQSWPRVANVRLQGFDACAGTPTGVLVLRLVDGVTLDVTEGHLGRGAEHHLTVGVARSDLFKGLIPHALAHALGLTEAGYVDQGCTGAPANNVLDAKGECRPRPVLSFVDRARARELYGALPVGELDPRATSFDGDRLADLVLLEPSGAGARVGVALASGDDFAAKYSGTWADLETMPSGVHAGDYNGDGLTDLGLYDRPRGAFSVRLSTGTGFAGPQAELWRMDAPPNSKVITGDYDADGKTDLVFFTPNRQLRLARATELGFAPLLDGLPGQEFGGIDGRHMAGDFDGDGRIDLAYLEPSQIEELPFDTHNTLWLALSEGTRFRPMGIFIPAQEFGSLAGPHYTIDLEGDGREELAYYEPTDGAVWPAGYAPPNSTTRPGPRSGAPAWLSGVATPMLADFDGDGISDFAYLDTGTRAVRLMRTREGRIEPPVGATPLAATTITLLASSRDTRGL